MFCNGIYQNNHSKFKDFISEKPLLVIVFFCFDSKKETFDNFFPTNAFAVQTSVFQTAKTVKTESVFFKRISLQNTGTGFIDILETFAVIKIEGFGVTS